MSAGGSGPSSAPLSRCRPFLRYPPFRAVSLSLWLPELVVISVGVRFTFGANVFQYDYHILHSRHRTTVSIEWPVRTDEKSPSHLR
jgi:hypothetical protein